MAQDGKKRTLLETSLPHAWWDANAWWDDWRSRPLVAGFQRLLEMTNNENVADLDLIRMLRQDLFTCMHKLPTAEEWTREFLPAKWNGYRLEFGQVLHRYAREGWEEEFGEFRIWWPEFEDCSARP